MVLNFSESQVEGLYGRKCIVFLKDVERHNNLVDGAAYLVAKLKELHARTIVIDVFMISITI